MRDQRHQEQAYPHRHGEKHPSILADRSDPFPPGKRGNIAGYANPHQNPEDLVHTEKRGVQQVGN